MIVDDHPVVRQGVRMILTAEQDIKVVSEVGTALEAITCVRNVELDLVILDINLPDQNGLVVLQQIRQYCPNLPVLVLSIQPEEHVAVRALKMGGNGFLSKESAPDELVRAARTLVSGRRYISPRLAEWLATEASGHRESLPHERLSGREYQVMCRLAAGKSISDISAELNRSVNTISTYRTRVLAKMGLASNAALTEYALTHQLLH